MSALYQLSDGSEGAQPDGSGFHQNGSIHLSDSEAERSARLLSTFSGFPGEQGSDHPSDRMRSNVGAQVPVPPAINFGGACRHDESSSPA